MYPQKISQSIVSSQPNLGNFFKENMPRFYFIKYNMLLRRKLGECKNFKDVNKKIRDLIKNGNFYRIFLQAPQTSRNGANNLLKVWAHHCECVLAQRLRRCHQMFCLYSKWWEEKALKDFMRKMRQSLAKKGKEFALGTVGVSLYNWEENRIPDEDIKKHSGEFEYIKTLKDNTICLSCDPTQRTSNNTRICECGTTGKLPTKTYDEWVPFIEKTDLIVWRKPHSSGQSEYKVFGSYADVSAEDFLNTQIDIDYRRKWDNTAVVLEVGETDTDSNSNSDIIYWEMLWPRLFVNRDYVFHRRYLVDEETNTIYIVSRSTEYPKFPKYPEKFRIEDYWSYMVIKPYEDMKKPGLEFSLTYFDNPGVNVPSSVTMWVATRAMPDFLARLREAAKNYKSYCLSEGVSQACKVVIEEERLAEAQRQKEKLDYCSFLPKKLKTMYPEFEPIEILLQQFDANLNISDRSKNVEKKVDKDASDDAKSESGDFWKYLHPMYYFH
ncbi:unnamed protein product [Phaedon cochleariae]|uniref:Phosphatidylcholine transfer protein n=1 Tax=Phaedon cochleariae TaxID=80249 RepID=A0A9P0DTS7_PHACE|nr:unnamed protein product [Phaedon cochleariae]